MCVPSQGWDDVGPRQVVVVHVSNPKLTKVIKTPRIDLIRVCEHHGVLPTGRCLDADLFREGYNLCRSLVLILLLVAVPKLSALISPPGPQGAVLANGESMVLAASHDRD